MKTTFVYPGSFCPPTYGHLAVVKKAVNLFPNDIINIVCSVNPDKKPWFTPEECVEMWRTYDLPKNVKLGTLNDFAKEKNDKNGIVMIRGIRGEDDLDHEKEVVLFNQKHFGIENYVYILSDCDHKDISSTDARKAAESLDLMALGTMVSPMVVTKLLEKTLKIKNLFMVVGKAGSGKSTFLKMVAEESPDNIYINTDDFTHQLRPLLEKTFGAMNLVDIAIDHKEELKKVIGEGWLELVKNALRTVPPNSNVFLEIPYGCQDDKMAFRYFGGKLVYVGCEDDEENKRRVVGRGTPEIVKFVDKIPGKQETLDIKIKYKLALVIADSSGDIAYLKKQAEKFSKTLKEEFPLFAPYLWLLYEGGVDNARVVVV